MEIGEIGWQYSGCQRIGGKFEGGGVGGDVGTFSWFVYEKKNCATAIDDCPTMSKDTKRMIHTFHLAADNLIAVIAVLPFLSFFLQFSCVIFVISRGHWFFKTAIIFFFF